MKGKQRLGMGYEFTVVRKRKLVFKMRNVGKNSVKKTSFGADIVCKVLEDLKKAGGNRLCYVTEGYE